MTLTIKAKLARVRLNDAEHEAMMAAAAKAAGVNLKMVLEMQMASKDRALLRMFAKAASLHGVRQ